MLALRRREKRYAPDATKHIPKDRVIDGVDQTSILMNGDAHGRRDYVHIYTGPVLAASVKQQFKRHWIGERPGLAGKAFYDLYRDPREEHGMMAQFLWDWGASARRWWPQTREASHCVSS